MHSPQMIPPAIIVTIFRRWENKTDVRFPFIFDIKSLPIVVANVQIFHCKKSIYTRKSLKFQVNFGILNYLCSNFELE
jgi:hypothetical protein